MDLKKILLISLGVFIIVAGLLYFLLSGSGGKNEEVGPITLEAQALIDDGETEKALDLLLDNEKDLDDTGLELLEEIKTAVYPALLEEAQEALENEDYVLAYENYQRLVQVASSDDKEEIKENLKELEKLVKEINELQEAFASYKLTFDDSIEQSNELLKAYKAELDNLEVGLITTDQFAVKIKGLISDSNEILNELDTALSVNNTDLLEIHQAVVTLMNKQHNMFLKATALTKSEQASKLEELKSTYLEVKNEQIEIVRDLNDFAIENKLDVKAISEKSKEEKSTETVDETEVLTEDESTTEEETSTETPEDKTAETKAENK